MKLKTLLVTFFAISSICSACDEENFHTPKQPTKKRDRGSESSQNKQSPVDTPNRPFNAKRALFGVDHNAQLPTTKPVVQLDEDGDAVMKNELVHQNFQSPEALRASIEALAEHFKQIIQQFGRPNYNGEGDIGLLQRTLEEEHQLFSCHPSNTGDPAKKVTLPIVLNRVTHFLASTFDTTGELSKERPRNGRQIAARQQTLSLIAANNNLLRNLKSTQTNAPLAGAQIQLAVYKLWIESFFRQAKKQIQEGKGNVYLYRLDEIESVFSERLSNLEKALDTMVKADEDININFIKIYGADHPQVRSLKEDWQDLQKVHVRTLFSELKTALSGLRHTFTVYLYTAGYDDKMIIKDLSYLTRLYQGDPLDHKVGRISNQQELLRFLDSMSTYGMAYYKLPEITLKGQLHEQISNYLNENYVNLRKAELVRSKLSTNQDKRRIVVGAINEFMEQLLDTLKLRGGSTKTLRLEGRRLFHILFALSKLDEEMNHDPNLEVIGKAVDAIADWQSRVNEYIVNNPIENALPKGIKTGL